MLADRVVDVVAVRDHRDDGARLRELPQHVAVGVDLVLAAPAGDRAVLGRGNRETGHRLAVVRTRGHQARHVVGAHEVDEVRRAAERRRFRAGYAARAEVMQLERQLPCRIVAGALEELPDRLLGVPAGGRHRDRIPEAQQHRLEVGRHPIRIGIGGLDRHQGLVRRNDRAFGHCADADRHVSAVPSTM